MKIWGIHKKYPSLSWWVNFMGHFISIGPLTIFGANAMNWTAQLRTKRWGVICFTLPVLARWQKGRHDDRKVFKWYFYCSPNGTPGASTFYRGSNRQERIRAQIRKLNFGHNFNTSILGEQNYALNQRFDGLLMSDYQMHVWARKESTVY